MCPVVVGWDREVQHEVVVIHHKTKTGGRVCGTFHREGRHHIDILKRCPLQLLSRQDCWRGKGGAWRIWRLRKDGNIPSWVLKRGSCLEMVCWGWIFKMFENLKNLLELSRGERLQRNAPVSSLRATVNVIALDQDPMYRAAHNGPWWSALCPVNKLFLSIDITQGGEHVQNNRSNFLCCRSLQKGWERKPIQTTLWPALAHVHDGAGEWSRATGTTGAQRSKGHHGVRSGQQMVLEKGPELRRWEGTWACIAQPCRWGNAWSLPSKQNSGVT